jgi:hypothetical protein
MQVDKNRFRRDISRIVHGAGAPMDRARKQARR